MLYISLDPRFSLLHATHQLRERKLLCITFYLEHGSNYHVNCFDDMKGWRCEWAVSINLASTHIRSIYLPFDVHVCTKDCLSGIGCGYFTTSSSSNTPPRSYRLISALLKNCAVFSHIICSSQGHKQALTQLLFQSSTGIKDNCIYTPSEMNKYRLEQRLTRSNNK